ncbi:MAG: DUF4179 domain-containing protein [Eubacterium sp.]|nr:DUF4179 domain-containing protein [Eubacterium sp.]
MKYNLSDILNTIDVEETEAIIDSVKINYNETIAQKIKERVITEEENKKDKRSKARRLSFKTIIAFAAVFLILFTSVTVGATVYFKPDSSMTKLFNISENIDLNALGKTINVSSESKGYEFKLKQVLSDNSTIYAVFDCPSEDAGILVPDIDNMFLFIDGKEVEYRNFATNLNNDVFYLTISDFQGIKNNSNVKLNFNSIRYYGIDADSIDGTWKFEFSIGKTDIKQKFKSDSVFYYVSGVDSTNTFKITNMEVSPIALYIDATETDIEEASVDETKSAENRFKSGTAKVIIKMKDGSVYAEGYDNNSLNVDLMSIKTVGQKAKVTIEVNFEKYIINPDDIQSITVFDTVVYEA